MKLLFAMIFGACGWLPPDSPPQKPAPPDPIAHVWVVENHVLSGRATLSERDALDMHGRKVEITPTGYATPWHGRCEEAKRESADRMFAEIIEQADLAGESRATAISFGFGDPITEYKLSCGTNRRVPTLVLDVSGKRAMTCFGGVCYLLSAS